MQNHKALFDQCLKSQHPIILDGGLGTQLEAQGLSLDSPLWSADILLNNPQAIIDAHISYFNAGATCAISASYQATVSGFELLGMSADDARHLITLSVELADQARKKFHALNSSDNDETLLVAASIGPYGAALGDGSEYHGDYGIDDTTLADFHKQRLRLLDQSRADILACETIPSIQEARVLSELLKTCQTPAWVSFSCKDAKHLNDGSPIAAVAQLFEHHPTVRAVGVNCSSPEYINGLIDEIKSSVPALKVVVYPNSGEQYCAASSSWSGTATPIECGEAAKEWRQHGAEIIGGCCRMGPEHIASIKQSAGH